MGVPRIGLIALIVFFAACSSFDADSGTTPPPSDAGPGSSTDAGTNAGHDASATEGGPIEPGPATNFCDEAVFCDDFERLQGPQGSWGALLKPISDDKVGLTADRPQQGQHALRFEISATSDTHHASMKTTLARGGKTKATYRFAYRPPQSFGVSGHTDLAYLAIPNGAGSDPVQVALLATNTGLYLYALDKTGPAGINTVVAAHSLETWNQAVIHVDFAAHTASFDINGKPGPGPLAMAYDTPLPDTLDVWVGPDYGSQESAFVIDFDAVRLDLE